MEQEFPIVNGQLPMASNGSLTAGRSAEHCSAKTGGVLAEQSNALRSAVTDGLQKMFPGCATGRAGGGGRVSARGGGRVADQRADPKAQRSVGARKLRRERLRGSQAWPCSRRSLIRGSESRHVLATGVFRPGVGNAGRFCETTASPRTLAQSGLMRLVACRLKLPGESDSARFTEVCASQTD